MKAEIRFKPVYATLFVQLEGKDRIVAESNAMASMSSNIDFDTRMSGSFLNAFGKLFGGGESLFVNEFYVEDATVGEVVLTQKSPGDVEMLELNGNSMCFQPGSFMACTPEVKIDTQFAGFKSLFAGEGLFRIIASGTGRIWFSCYGGLIEKEVQGEYIVDSSHLVAYEPHLKLNLQTATGGLVSSFLSKEGLVSRLEGNGKIYMQSRSINGLASWLNPRIP